MSVVSRQLLVVSNQQSAKSKQQTANSKRQTANSKRQAATVISDGHSAFGNWQSAIEISQETT